MICTTDQVGHYAVIFTSKKTDNLDGYGDLVEQMLAMAAAQPGYVGVESFGEAPYGVTISYWDSREAIAAGGKNSAHKLAQQRGWAQFYESFALRICQIEDVRRK